MLKAMTTVVCVLCVGVVGTLAWVKSEAKTRQVPPVGATISIEELHARIDSRTLPDREIREAF